MRCEMCGTETMMISYQVLGRATWEINGKPLDLNKPDFLAGTLKGPDTAICSECGHEQPIDLSVTVCNNVLDIELVE